MQMKKGMVREEMSHAQIFILKKLRACQKYGAQKKEGMVRTMLETQISGQGHGDIMPE